MWIRWVGCGIVAWVMVIHRTVFRAKKTARALGSLIVLLACLLTGPVALGYMISSLRFRERCSNCKRGRIVNRGTRFNTFVVCPRCGDRSMSGSCPSGYSPKWYVKLFNFKN